MPISYDEAAAQASPGTVYRRTTRVVIDNHPQGAGYSVQEADAAFIKAQGSENFVKTNIQSVRGFAGAVDAAKLAMTFPLKNPLDDSLIEGADPGTVAQLQILLYSWVREEQRLLDLAASPS